MTQPNKKPIADVKIAKIVGSIFANETEKGTRYNVTFARLYRSDDGQWKRTESFGRDDLLLLAKVADQVHTQIVALLANPKDDE